MVWLHHFFTMRAGADVNAVFGIMSMIIAVPTGVKVFNWLFTLYRGRVTFEPPVLWSIGFMVTFVIGGMTGVLLAVPPIDFVVHNSVFLVAQPGIAVGLVVLAIAQIGVHLVFFLHMGSGPDNTNNILALAFGTLVVFLVIGGSIWIIASLDANMMMTMPGDIPR